MRASEPALQPAASPEPRPVFILGMTQRSGTNLLYRALLKHPDCAAGRQPGEDFLLHEVDALERYVERVARNWNPRWDADGARSEDLARSLGKGLLCHLRPDDTCTAFVTKTPSARNVEAVPRFMPTARVLLVVRDGRDVAESGVRGLGWTYGEAFRRWADAAEHLLPLIDRRADWLQVVRFEALVSRPATELGRALSACDLSLDRYPFDELAALPIYGSSIERGGRDEVHWDPVSKPAGFDPTGRWRSWDDSLRSKYDRSCGALAEALGYAREEVTVRGVRQFAARVRARLDRR